MYMQQIGVAIVNDRTTQKARDEALRFFVDGGNMDQAIHMLLPTVFNELKKPIYSGVTFDESSWTAAAYVLNHDIDAAIEAKGVTK